MKISITICTFNPNISFLTRSIESVFSQSDRDFDFSIVDNNSTFLVGELPIIKKHGIKTIVEKRQGLLYARQRALNESSSDLIVFVDDDNVLDKDYIKNVRHLMGQNTNIVCISGIVNPEYEITPEDWIIELESFLAIRRNVQGSLIENTVCFYNNDFPSGAGMAIRNNLLKEYYDHSKENLLIEGRKGHYLSSGEDTDICLFAIHRGHAVAITNLLELLHLIPKERLTVSYFNNLAKSFGRSNIQINKKWSKLINSNVFPEFNLSTFRLLVKIFYFRISMTKKKSVLIKYLSEILRYKIEKR